MGNVGSDVISARIIVRSLVDCTYSVLRGGGSRRMRKESRNVMKNESERERGFKEAPLQSIIYV